MKNLLFRTVLTPLTVTCLIFCFAACGKNEQTELVKTGFITYMDFEHNEIRFYETAEITDESLYDVLTDYYEKKEHGELEEETYKINKDTVFFVFVNNIAEQQKCRFDELQNIEIVYYGNVTDPPYTIKAKGKTAVELTMMYIPNI